MIKSVLVVVCLVAVVSAAKYDLRRPMEASVPIVARPEWTRLRRADGNDTVELTFAVKQSNLAELERTLLRVSDPRHPDYGKHLSMHEVNALVAPPAAAVDAVLDWLAAAGAFAAGAVRMSSHGDFVSVVATVEVAERLLDTEYFVYRHTPSAASATTKRQRPVEVVRVGRPYSLPVEVAPFVDFVSPTLRFPNVRRANVRVPPPQQRQAKGSDGSEGPRDIFITPDYLRQLYQIGSVVGTNQTNVQGVASFLEEYYSPTDLQEFFTFFQNTSVGHTVAQNFGPQDYTDPGMEANLDIQYIMSVGAMVPTWHYYTPGRAPDNPDNEPFLAWVQNVSMQASTPLVFSVSYGEDEKSVGLDYGGRINAEFQKMGVRGISIMFASGDDGAGGNCTGSRLTPDFPAGSPWVTAVGGMMGGTAGSTPTGEIGDIISGSGFSDYWPRPGYQDDAVLGYIKNTQGLPDPKDYNQTGRGYPDVAAQSEFFTIVWNYIPLPGVSGTSCAAPTFSGVVALLNDIRLNKGKPPLGFLNPFIYQTGASVANAFNDATIGENFGCDLFGFPAAKGWDAITGWGSPNYSILKGVVESLP